MGNQIEHLLSDAIVTVKPGLSSYRNIDQELLITTFTLPCLPNAAADNVVVDGTWHAAVPNVEGLEDYLSEKISKIDPDFSLGATEASLEQRAREVLGQAPERAFTHDALSMWINLETAAQNGFTTDEVLEELSTIFHQLDTSTYHSPEIATAETIASDLLKRHAPDTSSCMISNVSSEDITVADVPDARPTELRTRS